MTTTAAARSFRGPRIAARALGNVLIGVAIGLLLYYGITDVESGVNQKAMSEELEKLGPIATERPAVSSQTSVLDFTGWAEQDAAFWRSAPMGSVIGRLVIGRMKLDTPVVKGADRESLKRGPGWIATTSVPGPKGNCAISGHRTTYLAPFRHLDQLREGDTIDLYTPYRRYRYQVSRSFTVRPWQVEVIAPTPEPILTLTACHPPYSARFRLIVQSRLIEARPLKGAPPVETSD